MKKIALVLSAFALLAFSGMARAEGTDTAPAGDKAPKTSKKTSKTTKTEANSDGTGSTETKTKTEKTAK